MASGQLRQKASDNRALSFGASIIDPRAWLHLLRMVHYYNYSHVQPRRLADIGPGVRMAPNVSMRNGERIKIGAYSHIGADARFGRAVRSAGLRWDITPCWVLRFHHRCELRA